MQALALSLTFGALTMVAAPPRPQGPCDIYAAAGKPCVAAHSTTRALYASYNGPLYQVLRQSDGKTLDIGVVKPSDSPVSDAGGYANAAAQDAFCANTYCWISKVYDQSPKRNDLIQAPRGAFSGPAMGGFNNLPIADMAPVTVMGHKVYGVFIAPGMGLRQNDVKGTAVDDQAEGQYWVVNGLHYNSGCCFDYGNAEIDSRDDDNGTMETTYFGNATAWYHGSQPGPWVMTDQENNLVGCVTTDGTKNCPTLPNITSRFVTGVAKGEPHHWTSMGGDAQNGDLKVMFDGPRVDATYDPMRKQGAILLGNGGDNSNASQGTFYEGAMTAAGTFPSNATDGLIHANVVAAKYDVARLSLAPASAIATPPGLQTFSPGSSQDTTVTFTNTTGAPVTGVKLNISVPKGWTASGNSSLPATVAPGASVSATFKVASGMAPFNGDLVANASWTNANGKTQSETTAEKVRNVSPIKINEFRISAGSATDSTNSFIELYNAGDKEVDLSNWTLTEHPTQQAIFSSVKISASTKLAAKGFYLLGLSNSGLSAPARKGDGTVYVRNTTGMNVGDPINIEGETRKIASVGTAAGNSTTLWQPLPEGPVITIPAGATNVPVTSVAGFTVGGKIALGYGATFPAVAKGLERYEIATITAVGKPGTQEFLGADAAAGATNIKVTSVENISTGDKIRLDVDSVGHGIETVTVTRVGTPAIRSGLTANAGAGATRITIRGAGGPGRGFQGGAPPFAVGDKLTVGTPANKETVTVTAVGGPTAGGGGGPFGGGFTIDITPALAHAHIIREGVVAPGTGLDLAAPLKFNHAANLPFSARGTGISFQPATAFAHSSNEPVQPLGTGIKLDSPLAADHAVDAVVRDAAVTTAGYQGSPAPNQWFGGPALSSAAGNMILRDAGGLVVDSLNYGGLVDPWASEGYQATSGTGQSGCRVISPGAAGGFGQAALAAAAINRSAGRFPDGADTDSNCADFLLQPATTLPAGSAAGATNIKVASAADFAAGQTITLDADANQESAVIATVGTGGATTVGAATGAGAVLVPIASAAGFIAGQTVTIDSGANQETAVVASFTGGRGGATITLAAPLAHAHAAGASLSGSGITLTNALTRAHDRGTQAVVNMPTPGAPNQYSKSGH
ncbi:MAG TPA: arabinofuranosidase catalytic domain-containing protein [Bryobacteraceae bacterium]|nr:arabinofuranosidase catalytic domain-containing protein [Bryobacteraceae bacterium]